MFIRLNIAVKVPVKDPNEPGSTKILGSPMVDLRNLFFVRRPHPRSVVFALFQAKLHHTAAAAAAVTNDHSLPCYSSGFGPGADKKLCCHRRLLHGTTAERPDLRPRCIYSSCDQRTHKRKYLLKQRQHELSFRRISLILIAYAPRALAGCSAGSLGCAYGFTNIFTDCSTPGTRAAAGRGLLCRGEQSAHIRPRCFCGP
jgi:hypothetical protein